MGMNTRVAGWMWIGLLGLLGGSASGQITPERMYYGVDKRIIVEVSVPEGGWGRGVGDPAA